MIRNITIRLAMLGLFLPVLVTVISAQRDFDRARHVVAQADDHLKNISGRERFSEKERERYDNALKHLSEFDQGLSRSKYDKDKLDAVIEDVNSVCKENTLSPSERDVLQDDLRSLRELRVDWK